MSEKATIQQISPGMCPPEGCPPFDRIECIVVKKVYDSCFQIDERTRNFTFNVGGATGPFNVGTPVPCELAGPIDCEELKRTPIPGQPGFFTVTILVKVPLRLRNPNNPNQTQMEMLTFVKNVTLCCPEGTEVSCTESTFLFCNCVITDFNMSTNMLTVTCDIQVCLVIKCTLDVQLLVPSYGFCVPAPCITLPGVCPPLPPAQCF